MFPELARHGGGRPGLARADLDCWVLRDERGRVVAGAMITRLTGGHPPFVDVAVDPDRQGEGWGTRLYAALGDEGLDMEAASASSLAHRTLTQDGYLFMRGRRQRADPDAEHTIIASAGVCPRCGPCGLHGEPLDGWPEGVEPAD